MKKILYYTGTALICMTPAFAATTEQAEASEGNLLIWFLCAVAFLKVSQNLDSLLAALGFQQPKRGGLMSELLIAGRAIKMAASLAGGALGVGKAVVGSNTARAAGAGLSGLASGAIGRAAVSGVTHSGSGVASKIGMATFNSSVKKGGAFASDIVGAVAKGSIASTGSMTGEQAAQALTKYLGINPVNTSNPESIPSFKNVEIGGGRITGFETSGESTGRQFAMYHVGQYMRPTGDFEMVKTTDGESWFKQYAAPVVQKTPYEDASGRIKYDEKIVEQMPPIPRRKDKV